MISSKESSENSSIREKLRRKRRRLTLRKLVSVLFILPLFFIAPITGCESLTDSSLAPGRNAPDLSLVDLDGNKKSLADFRGKLVVLNFLTSWCKPCEDEMPALNRLHEKMKGRVIVVGVGVEDDDSALKEFKERNKVVFPFLHDPSGLAKQRYRIGGYPETFVLDREGKLLLLPDPASANEPKLKFVGPREWDSPQIISILNALGSS